jgi:hypothetical protein
MAGAEAEEELLGTKIEEGDRSDRRDIALMGAEIDAISEDQFWERVEPRLRAMTRMLVRRHKALIERVAKSLLAKTTLSGPQLDKMVGVPEVKPYAYVKMDENERKVLLAALAKPISDEA